MPRISANQAAARFGVSPDTVLRRIKSHQLVGTKDNRGKWWVVLPDDPANDDPEPPADPANMRSTAPYPRGAQTAEQTSEMTVLTEALTKMVERMERQHQSAIQLLTERIDSAECRAEQAEQRLFEVMDRMSRPWWSRWLARP
ncbi:MAG: hypothetical protein HQL37_09485 [Alphaproteobacteria bacterium]|nr:hypothetical protein [Alphaproteobacteria bacterium]